MLKKKVALIGIGPHAKRIYLNYFKKHSADLELVVDLDSKRQEIREYLDKNGFRRTKIFTIKDKLKDNKHLSKVTSQSLLDICKTLEITHIIISTEPKAHYMYLEFALKNNINVLTDKPITVSKNMTSENSIKEVRKQYYEILKLAENSKSDCKVMCQRQYHKGYEYIKTLLLDIVKKYKVPITYIDIYHCDGNWEMAHDLDKENHPYKYGYGKLFHSGYHFIDLLSDFLKINNQLTGPKKITKGEVYSNCFTPNDELAVFNIDDYKNIFKKQNIPAYYYENKKIKFNKYGEKNYYGLLKFSNSYNQVITNASLNLLHYGFSRRGWIETKDFYKSNGRIRHERINIQVGTLINVQVHSYQSKEIKDRLDLNLEEECGGLEHFDIDIYRNVDIIGGKPYERIKLGDLYTKRQKEGILGYNELSREDYLNKFLKGKCSKGDIRDQALAIEILYSCALGIKNYYNNISKPEKIEVRNKNTYPIKVKELSKYSNFSNSNEIKEVLDYCIFENDKYEFNILINKLKNKNTYESFISIADVDSDIVAGALMYKESNSRILSYLYFYFLKWLTTYFDIKTIAKILEKTAK